jgi:hypothetical protein
VFPTPAVPGRVATAAGITSPHEAGHWNECRNALAIARLLTSEGRPAPLVRTACRMAVENACRAALEPAGFPWDGDLAAALRRLSVPEEIVAACEDGPALDAAQRTVDWMAAYLRVAAPGRSWSC